MARVLLQHLVLHGETAIGIDGAFLRHEIAHVTVRGEHLEVLAEVLLDGTRLGGRLDDDEILGHELLGKRLQRHASTSALEGTVCQ